MTQTALDEGSAALRLESYVAKAVHQRGLWSVLRIAIAASCNQPRIPADLSPRLRADMGLPPDTTPVFWPQPSDHPQVPLPMWLPGL